MGIASVSYKRGTLSGHCSPVKLEFQPYLFNAQALWMLSHQPDYPVADFFIHLITISDDYILDSKVFKLIGCNPDIILLYSWYCCSENDICKLNGS